MTRNLKLGLLLLVMVCLIATGVFTISISRRFYRWYNPYLDQNIAGPTTITSTWLEIEPKPPLTSERQTQSIALDVGKTIKMEQHASGLALPDGTVVQPQVQLVGDDGAIYELNVHSFFLSDSGETLAQFSRHDLPKGTTYVRVRIRANQPIQCQRIFWRNYNQWEAEKPM